jgi:hypothetical protein
MINFEFTKSNGNNTEGKIKITIDESSSFFYNKNQFPLRLLHKKLTGEVEWSTDLYPGWFSEYLMCTYTTLEIIDSLGNKLLDWKWDPFINGDYAHQYFEIWSLNNIGSNGIAIGTHNGMTGEWVGPINKGILKGTLVEASDNQYNDLFRFYNGKTWVTCLQSLITTNGDDVLFYEGGNGFTNSLSNKIIEQYVNIDLINSSIKKSKSINDLIIESSERGRVKWLHIDVEGLDGELIYAIKDDLLPELLLFESLHMENEYYDNLCNYLTNKGYSITKSGWNTICIK